MTSLTFPDINVWLALVTSEHVHHASASRWWEQETNRIGFSRLTQLGFLRLMTTAAEAGGEAAALAGAWVGPMLSLSAGPGWGYPRADWHRNAFSGSASGRTASPKLWADAWLQAFAECAGGAMVTFDRALAARARNAILLS